MFSERQRVVVVDDNYDEVKNLLSALWKKGIPYIYLNGQMEDIPAAPFSGVRLIFIDIILNMESPSDKNNAAPIANIIRKIVGGNPGPYSVVFWTKNDKLIGDVLRYLKSADISPVGYIDLEKPTKLDDMPTIIDLMLKLEEKLSLLESFNYILEWESLVEETMHKFSANLFSVVPSDGNINGWSNRIQAILGTLALSYAESSGLENNENDIRNAFLLLTDSFKDSLQQILKTKPLDYTTKLSQESLSLEQIAKLNTSLFVDFQPDKKVSLGNVFIINQPDEHLKESLYKNIYPDNKIQDGTLICGMIVTPLCDIAHSKYLHNQKNCYRILYGLMIPVMDYEQVENSLKPGWIEKKKQDLIDELREKGCLQKYVDTVNKYFQKSIMKDSVFRVEPLWHDQQNQTFILLFHFGSLSSVWWDDNDVPRFEFAIKEHLAFDIQSKLANHINRLGNSMLQFE
jgi:hypothetical protein